jgi:4,5-dihydroxyphthalate decarboxylase
MSKLRLAVAIGAYEINRALIEGEVTADGLDLVFLSRMGSQELVSRMIRAREFDVAETGLNYIVNAAAKGQPAGFTGVPIFTHRRFRHGFAFVNAASGIKSPKDLIGQKVSSMYLPTGNVWMRGILEEFYGVPYKQVKWVGERMGLYQMTPSWHEMPGPGVRGQDLLAEGKVAAMVCPDLPPLVAAKDPRIAQLFPRYWDEEVAYYKQTGIFPIMHSLIIKTEIAERYPWVVTNLIKAFDQSKKLALKKMINPRFVPLAFFRTAYNQQQELLGADPWPYALPESNRKNLQTFMRYMIQQEMLDKEVPVDKLFAPFDLDDATPDDWN